MTESKYNAFLKKFDMSPKTKSKIKKGKEVKA